MRVAPASDQVRAWRPAVPGVSEVFHARFASHAYPTHAHGTWTLFIVDDGAVRYDLDRHPNGSDPSMVTLLPPHIAHDGRPATNRGYRMRVLYLDGAVLGEHLIGSAIDRPIIPDPTLRRSLSTVMSCSVALTTPWKRRVASRSLSSGLVPTSGIAPTTTTGVGAAR